jgi:rhamnosyltransferase
MPELRTVSVVIPVLDGADTLPQLLARLLEQQTPFRTEIIAVESGSRDDSLRILEEHRIRIIEIPTSEFDHGSSRNLGVQLGAGEVAVLLTQDAIPVGRDFLAALVAPFADPAVAGVYGRQIPRPDCDVVTKRQLEGWLTGRSEPEVVRLNGEPFGSFPPEVQHRLSTFDNVCSAVRRSVWEQIPFPPAPFGEDLAWAKAALCSGHAIAYEPAAAVIHSHRRSVVHEYRRTRICHQVLNELFGLATLPRRRYVARAAVANLRHDIPYVLEHAEPARERALQLLRVAGLSVLSPLAQYHGIRDAQRRRAQAVDA